VPNPDPDDRQQARLFWTGLFPEDLRALERDPLGARSPLGLSDTAANAADALIIPAVMALLELAAAGQLLLANAQLSGEALERWNERIGVAAQPMADGSETVRVRNARLSAEAAGLLQRKRGQLILTPQGRELLAMGAGAPRLLLPRLLRGWARRPLWGDTPFDVAVHASWPLLVALLHRFGGGRMSFNEYVRALEEMTPEAQKLAKGSSPEAKRETALQSLMINLVVEFGVLFGVVELVDPEAADDDADTHDVVPMLRATPLLPQLLPLYASYAHGSEAFEDWAEEVDAGGLHPNSPFAGIPAAAGAAGVPDFMADLRRDLLAAMSQQDFKNDAEAQAFADRFLASRNQQPLDDFDGLSSDEMSQLLNDPFIPPSPLIIVDAPARLPKSPILDLALDLIATLAQGPLQATGNGYLPRSYVQAALARHTAAGWDTSWTEFSRVHHETEFMHLLLAREAAEAADLIELRGTQWHLGALTGPLQRKFGNAGIYAELVIGLAGRADQAGSRGEDYPILHVSWGFSLLLLERYGRAWRSIDFYAGLILRAFPQLLEEARMRGRGATEEARRRDITMSYAARIFLHYALPLGLVEFESGGDDVHERVRARDTFYDLVFRATATR
jgi:hypothetical protein